MRRLLLALVPGCALAALIGAGLIFPRPARSAPDGSISLMQTFEEWRYPGIKQIDRATMSDAGTPPMQAVRCSATFRTPDPFDAVVAHYAKKVELGRGNAAVADLDDSKGRAASVRVLAVNRADSSTMLVITRAPGEAETHVAWTRWIRLPETRPGG